MPDAVLIWDERLASFDNGPGHPLQPERLTLTVALMEAYGLLGEDTVISPRMATDSDLRLVHSAGYIESVQEAGDWGAGLKGVGLGTEDNPIYPGMHEIAALTAGASMVGLEEVLAGKVKRAFSPAGGLHHAHRSRAGGFSIYNDAALAIACARQADPSLRIAYIDIDAHHGDGVQEAFWGSGEVMTISTHEVYAFPATGFPSEIGYGEGEGFAVNMPMPAIATDACYRVAFDRVVEPLTRAFAPDAIVAQLGVDAHHSDPLADLAMTLPGYSELVGRIIGLADELCDGRLLAVGGGGYSTTDITPRAWTSAFARLSGVSLTEEIPGRWRELVWDMMGVEAPRTLGADDRFGLPEGHEDELVRLTQDSADGVRALLFPYHGLEP